MMIYVGKNLKSYIYNVTKIYETSIFILYMQYSFKQYEYNTTFLRDGTTIYKKRNYRGPITFAMTYKPVF